MRKEKFSINLSKQIYIYSVDTSAFYTEKEQEIHEKLCNIAVLKGKTKKKLTNSSDIELKEQYKQQNAEYNQLKKQLREMFPLNGDNIRHLRESALKQSNVVAMFDGASTRTFGMKTNELSMEMIIVRVFYFDVLRDIMFNGFMHNGEKYVFFTASAGQVRTKKVMFVRESTWLKHQATLMCGLTIEKINELGGMNVNKLLAYLSLCNSATEQMSEGMFDIKKSIVVDDLETMVSGTVDYISPKTFEIERKVMGVPITHTDGAGMILPRKSQKSFMCRAPWIKGLLTPFAFDEFCREHGHNGDITDIYGTKYNIFDDDIEVIFTKSQFKMNKFYINWQNYIDNFISHGCQAGMCNEEPDHFRNARFNYQMLQTLIDMTDDELKVLSQKAVDEINNITSSRASMLRLLGVTKYNNNKTYLQQALEICPEMLSDNYCKEILTMVKRKMIKNAKHAKVEVDGKYTFIIPDMYAFCERLFLGREKPVGLLGDSEVSCRLYEGNKELDCLRSPHLYIEHGVRKNTFSPAINKWFMTNGLYISTHDLISKLLQCDFDGDTSLVCADKNIVTVAKRNMKDVVPLYYEMGTAKPVLVNPSSLFEGLVFAFSNSNIGIVSNNISKIENSEGINLDVVKIECMLNNYIIDSAKTLTKLDVPEHIERLITQHTNGKLPHFFIYAKDKSKDQVEPRNNSTVNRLEAMIPNKRLNFGKNILSNFDHKWLMKDADVETDQEIIDLYESFKMKNRFIINYDDIKHSNMLYVYGQNRQKLLEICPDASRLADILVRYLYSKPNGKKEALWYMFGDVLLENLRFNLKVMYGTETIICKNCYIRDIKKSNSQEYCSVCRDELTRKNTRKRVIKHRKGENVTQ